MHVKFDHCVVHVSDWARSNAFYRDILGAELVEWAPNRYSYRFGDCQLNLHGPGVIAEPLAAKPVQPGNGDLGFEWPGRLTACTATASPLNSGRCHARARGAKVRRCISGIRTAPF